MDQAPRVGQALNEAQLPSGEQPPTGAQVPNPARIDPLGPPNFQTPLGEPINQRSAAFLIHDPLTWHLNYWLNIGVIAILRGEDSVLTTLRIEHEILNMLDLGLSSAVFRAWPQFWSTNSEEGKRHWAQKTLESNEAQHYLNDINRMLVNKGQKVRSYLSDRNRLMMDSLEAGKFAAAKDSFNELVFVYRKLREEEAVDARVRNRFLSGLARADAEAIAQILTRANDAHNEEA